MLRHVLHHLHEKLLAVLVRRTFEDDLFGENSLGTSVSPAEWIRSLVRACSY